MLGLVKKYKVIIAGIIIFIVMAVILLNINANTGKNDSEGSVKTNPNAPLVSVSFKADSETFSVGKKETVDLSIEAGENNITAVDVVISYDASLMSAKLIPGQGFTAIINEEKNPGSIRFVAVNPTASELTGTVKIASLEITPKKKGSAKINLSDIRINASGVSGALRVNLTGISGFDIAN